MINIKVLQDYAEVSYQTNNKKHIKIISLSDIPTLFDTKITFDSGILPMFGEQNAYGIQRIIQRDKNYIVFVQAINPFLNTLHMHDIDRTLFKEKMKKLGIKTEKLNEIIVKKENVNGIKTSYCYNNAYYPNLLMVLSLKENGKSMTIDRSGLLAFKDPFINDKTILYDFPFSNTHKGSTFGQICWGSVGAPKIDSLSQTIGVMHMFLGSEMNTDLFNSFTINGVTLTSSSELLAYIGLRAEELNGFPYEDIQLKKGISYKDLSSYVQQNFK